MTVSYRKSEDTVPLSPHPDMHSRHTHTACPRWSLSNDFLKTLNRKRTIQFTPCKTRACNVVDATYVFVLKNEKKGTIMRIL